MALNEPLIGSAEPPALPSRSWDELCPPGHEEAPDTATDEDTGETEYLDKFQVDKVNGFWENTYRLLFPFEDKVAWPEGETKICLTCLNTGQGVIENTKVLKAELERGLIAFAYSQTVDEAQRKVLKERCREDHHIDEAELDKFMWDRPDGIIALVQTWSVKYNAEFKGKFKVLDRNPSEHLFEPQAVAEFEESMRRIFGKEALKKVGVKFCWASTFNPSPVYIAPAQALLGLLRECDRVRNRLNIAEVIDEKIVVTVKNKRGVESTKSFSLEMNEVYALYVKQGYDTMACATPLDKFLRERILNRRGLDKENIPSNLLPVSLPRWTYDPRVAKLFFSDPELVRGTLQIPQPIPMNSCVGPALWWARARALVLWTQVIATTWGLLVSGQDLAWVWPFFWCVSVPFGLLADFVCMRHFIVPWVQQAHGCVTPMLSLVLPDVGRHFGVWLPLSITASVVAMMSIQLNATFVARTWERQWLDEAQGQAEIRFWNEVMERSMFGGALDWTFWTPHRAALGLWLISISQLLVPLWNITRSPRDAGGPCDLTVKYVEGKPVGWESLTHRVRCGPLYVRSPERPITPFEALTDMAYAGGMATVGCAVFSYPLAEMSEALKLKKVGWERDALKYLIMAQKSAFLRLILDFLLKKSLQLKIQVSIYAIHRSMMLQCTPDRNSFPRHELVPIIVTLFTGLATQMDLVLTILKHSVRLYAEVKEKCLLDEYCVSTCQARWRIKHIVRLYAEVKEKCLLDFRTFSIVAIFLVGVGLSGYTLLQLIMIHTCESSLWNLTGCVSEDDVWQYLNFSCPS